MWTSFSASRSICLLTLAVVMLVYASQAFSFPYVAHDCCHGGQIRKVKDIKMCYKQEPQRRCPYNAFVIETSSSKRTCVQQDAQWLQNLLDAKKLTCRSQFSALGRFKVLDDEDDVEW